MGSRAAGTLLATTNRMSGKNNVNPGQYKIGGRDKQDDQARERMKGGRVQAIKTVPPHKKAQDKKTK